MMFEMFESYGTLRENGDIESISWVLKQMVIFAKVIKKKCDKKQGLAFYRTAISRHKKSQEQDRDPRKTFFRVIFD